MAGLLLGSLRGGDPAGGPGFWISGGLGAALGLAVVLWLTSPARRLR
jgi:hypothetical protein